MNIERDIFPLQQARSTSKPSSALPVINQIASEYTTETFTAGSNFTVPAGNAGDAVTIQLPFAPILGGNGRTGRFGSTTLALGGALATTLSTEVAFVATDLMTGDVSGLSNGQFMVDYEAGIIYGKRADAGTTGTATYSYWAAAQGGGGTPVPVVVIQRAAQSSSSNTVAVDTTSGGVQVVAANANRLCTVIFNTSMTTSVYFGAGTVTSSYQELLPGGTATWVSQEQLKALSASGSVNLKFTDYIN